MYSKDSSLIAFCSSFLHCFCSFGQTVMQHSNFKSQKQNKLITTCPSENRRYKYRKKKKEQKQPHSSYISFSTLTQHNDDSKLLNRVVGSVNVNVI